MVVAIVVEVVDVVEVGSGVTVVGKGSDGGEYGEGHRDAEQRHTTSKPHAVCHEKCFGNWG